MTRRAKAPDPIALRAQELEAVGLQPEAARLIRQADIAITREAEKRDGEGKKVSHNVARRMDAFDAARDEMVPGAYDAIRRYEADVALRRGEADRGPGGERVDRTAGLVTDAMLDAAVKCDFVASRVTDHEWWLLAELVTPVAERGGWRATVAFVTGIEKSADQLEAVAALAAKVQLAYQAYELQARPKAA